MERFEIDGRQDGWYLIYTHNDKKQLEMKLTDEQVMKHSDLEKIHEEELNEYLRQLLLEEKR